MFIQPAVRPAVKCKHRVFLKLHYFHLLRIWVDLSWAFDQLHHKLYNKSLVMETEHKVLTRRLQITAPNDKNVQRKYNDDSVGNYMIKTTTTTTTTTPV